MFAVDVQADTWNMDPDLLEEAITERTKAIMPVSIYGQPPDMDSINEIASRHGIPVIEDGAQSFGATYKGGKSCGLSTIGSTSFFPSKPLGCYGDGGALFTNDDDLAEKFRWIRVHGQERKHHHPILGINGRLDTLQATILLANFELFPEEVKLRQQVGQRYNLLLTNTNLPQLTLPHVPQHSTSVYAQYTILSSNCEALREKLSEQEIPSVSYYAVPLHLQPVFSSLGHGKGDFLVAESIAGQCLSLPMSPYLSKRDQDKVISAFGN